MGIRSEGEIRAHYLRGNLFENLVIVEMLKHSFNREGERLFYFWRNSNGREVDLLTERAGKIHAIEIKSSQTVKSGLLDGLRYFASIAAENCSLRTLVYAGKQAQRRTEISILPWLALAKQEYPWD